MPRTKLLYLILLGIISATAQNPNGWDTAWVRSFGGPSIDIGKDIKETSDKGFIIAGTSSTFGAGNTSFYIIKTDSLGLYKWSKSIGSSNNDVAYSIEIANDGGFFISGSSNWNLPMGYDGYLVKTDNLGNVMWSKNFGGNDWDFIYNSCIMPDGGLILCGESFSDSKGGADAYLIRTDANGDTLWTRKFGTVGDDAFYSVEQKGNTIFVVGKTYDTLTSKTRANICKIDFNGNAIKEDVYQGYVSENTVYKDLFITNGGDILLCGKHTSSITENYIFRKVDSVSFNQIYNTTSTVNINMNCVIEGSNSDAYILGTNFDPNGGLGASSALFYRFDQGFTYLQGANFGGLKNEEAFEIIKTSKGYAFIGSTTSYGNQNGGDNENVYLVIFNKPNLVNDYFLVVSDFQDNISPLSLNENKIYIQSTIVYPNPFNYKSTIGLSDIKLEGKTLKYQLFDQQGKLIDEENLLVAGQEIKISRKNIKNGIYHYRLTLNSLIIGMGKLSVE